MPAREVFNEKHCGIVIRRGEWPVPYVFGDHFYWARGMQKHISLCKGQEQRGVGPGRRPTSRLEEGMVGIQLEERG